MPNPQHVKIHFQTEGYLGDEEQLIVETLWAVPVAEDYRINNIPFYAYGVAWEDIVKADVDDNGDLSFVSLVKPSGNSVVRIRPDDETATERIVEQLREMGCDAEIFVSNQLIAVHIPVVVEYTKVKTYLEASRSILDYEEACLGWT